VPTPWERDLDRTREQLIRWLGGVLPRAEDIEVTDLAAPSSSGFSNETLLFDLRYREAGEPHAESLVLRIQPTGYAVFPHYDLGQQFRTMQLLAATDVPVPEMLWLESEDREIFGAPFYVMRRIDGRVPSDNPPYHASGWLVDATPEERRSVWLSCFEMMARIHRLDHRAVGFGFLEQPELGATGLDQEIAQYEKYLAWAARGRPQPTAEAAFEWIKANRPKDEPEGLVWGDARVGNIIYDGGKPAAVLDWEMVRIGPPGMDVGWAIFLDRHHSEGMGTPRLEGFPSYEETIAHYESHAGRKVENVDYYQVFAGFRFSVIMMRIAQQLALYGIMDRETAERFERDNMVTNLLARILELPPPAEVAP